MKKTHAKYSEIASLAMRNNYRLLLNMLFMIFILVWLVSADAQDLSKQDIYTQAPSPEELADKLYKPRYRSIVINNDTVQQKEENLFAMLINFEFDSTKIMPQSYPLLDSVGQMLNLQNVAEKQIVIEGHTDSIGNDQYNLSLSQRRAQAIKEYLANNYKVATERMIITGKGETELFDARDPRNEVNRRVQFRPNS